MNYPSPKMWRATETLWKIAVTVGLFSAVLAVWLNILTDSQKVGLTLVSIWFVIGTWTGDK